MLSPSSGSKRLLMTRSSIVERAGEDSCPGRACCPGSSLSGIGTALLLATVIGRHHGRALSGGNVAIALLATPSATLALVWCAHPHLRRNLGRAYSNLPSPLRTPSQGGLPWRDVVPYIAAQVVARLPVPLLRTVMFDTRCSARPPCPLGARAARPGSSGDLRSGLLARSLDDGGSGHEEPFEPELGTACSPRGDRLFEAALQDFEGPEDTRRSAARRL